MNSSLQDIQDQFIAEWAVLGQAWGINRTMAQIQALFLCQSEPMNTDQVMEKLAISRGNAHANIKELLSWNLLKKVVIKGDRKEYFVGEQDPWKIFCKVARERRRREIEPLLQTLEGISNSLAEQPEDEANVFKEQVDRIARFAEMGNQVLERIAHSEESRITRWFLQLAGKKKD